MTYDEVLAQVLELLQRDRRVAYRVLKRRFELDDDYRELLSMTPSSTAPMPFSMGMIQG